MNFFKRIKTKMQKKLTIFPNIYKWNDTKKQKFTKQISYFKKFIRKSIQNIKLILN